MSLIQKWKQKQTQKQKQDEKWKWKLVMQIDSSNESHILICSIQCNFDNLLTKSDFIKFEPDTEMEMEMQSRDKRQQKWDKKQKKQVVLAINR